eukprot:2996975-Ditylum_brightwellii.AAC.1
MKTPPAKAFDHMCTVLEECGLGYPSKTATVCFKLTLGHQVRGYVKADSPPTHQSTKKPSYPKFTTTSSATLTHPSAVHVPSSS